MNKPAPIAVFIFNRPQHLQRTLACLARCDGFGGSPVTVFGDGPKRDEQVAQVDAARAVAREMLGDRVTYRFADRNKGLARSIVDGVNELTTEHGRAIVVEDDLGLAPSFLAYMNAALDRYEHADNVFQISGHMFDVPELRTSHTAVCLPFTTTWGWATWRRAWQQFDTASAGWQALQTDHALRRRFNLDDAYNYAAMLERQIQGRADSWGIRWYWNVFSRSGLCVYPPRSLVENRGMDGSGSHGRGYFRSFASAMDDIREVPALPDPVVDEIVFRAVKKAIYRQNGGAIGKVVDRVKRLVR